MCSGEEEQLRLYHNVVRRKNAIWQGRFLLKLSFCRHFQHRLTVNFLVEDNVVQSALEPVNKVGVFWESEHHLLRFWFRLVFRHVAVISVSVFEWPHNFHESRSPFHHPIPNNSVKLLMLRISVFWHGPHNFAVQNGFIELAILEQGGCGRRGNWIEIATNNLRYFGVRFYFQYIFVLFHK